MARPERRILPAPDRLGKNGGLAVAFREWYACSECDGKVDLADTFCRHCGVEFAEAAVG